jgi:hypothetical protein
MEKQTFPNDSKPQNGSGDAGYGSEENYAWLEKNDIENFFKYNTFHKEQHPPRKPELIEKAHFQSHNFPYDPVQDVFTCPAQHPMTYRQTRPTKLPTATFLSVAFMHVLTVPPVHSSQSLQRRKRIAVSNSVLNSTAIANRQNKICFPNRASLCARSVRLNPKPSSAKLNSIEAFADFHSED